jgi:hypothetical protein
MARKIPQPILTTAEFPQFFRIAQISSQDLQSSVEVTKTPAFLGLFVPDGVGTPVALRVGGR